MTAREWEADSIDGQPTIFSHALSLSALHGSAPWPHGGGPLPDETPATGEFRMPSVVLDGVRSHHFRPERPGEAEIDAIADEFARLGRSDSPRASDAQSLAGLHDALASVSAIGLADPLATAIRSRDLPQERLRAVARRLALGASRREPVKAAIVVLGTCGDRRDRDLLVLLGSLEEFTLYAVVAILATQPDGERAVFEVAQRVQNWGRIHAVKRLSGSQDPEIRAWLLRAGFRNGVMNEYLAHVAAMTGGLYEALLDRSPDPELIAGAGEILQALAQLRGPAKDMRHYPDAVPAIHRFAELAAEREPTLDVLHSLLSLGRFADREAGFDWPEGEPARLSARFGELLARPAWPELVRGCLAAPADQLSFNRALWCAMQLGLPVLEPALGHLGRNPGNAYAWNAAMTAATAHTVGQVADLARAVLPVDEICSGATLSIGLGGRYDTALETVVTGLKDYPGTGTDLALAALSARGVRLRRMALRTLRQWPGDYRGQVAAAAVAEPDPKLRAELEAYPAPGAPRPPRQR